MFSHRKNQIIIPAQMNLWTGGESGSQSAHEKGKIVVTH